MRARTLSELMAFVAKGLGPDTAALDAAFEASEEIEWRGKLDERLTAWLAADETRHIKREVGGVSLWSIAKPGNRKLHATAGGDYNTALSSVLDEAGA